MKKKILIEWDDEVINVEVTPKNTLKTPDIVSILEWVKLWMYENKKEIVK